MTEAFVTTTTEAWSVSDRAGTDHSLQNYCTNIVTWGGDKQKPPPLRGANVTVPFIPGSVGRNKVPDERIVSLTMWVLGANPDGSLPAPGTTRRALFNQNWRRLVRLLWNQGEPFTLTKRFYDETGVLRTAKAVAEYSAGLAPAMTGEQRADVAVDLKLADPFFYGPAVSIALDTAAAASAAVTILGDYPCRAVTIAGTAGAAGVVNPSVSVPTDVPIQSLTMQANVAAGAQLSIDTKIRQARYGASSALAVMAHQGGPDWLRLRPGAQTVQFGRTSGDWSGTLQYTPVWI